MADFNWDFTSFVVVTAVEGGLFISVTIDNTQIEFISSIESSSLISNPLGDSDFEIITSVISQFVTGYSGRNTVRWSDIDKIDFELSNQNIAGWKALEWEGNAWRVLRFKNVLIIYGEGGVSVFMPISEPVSTWSEYVLDSAGILGRDCVVDLGNAHLFIGRDFNLYHISEDSKSLKSNAIPVIQLVGFKEFVKTLIGSINMFYEPVTKVTYISASNKTLLLSQGELTEIATPIEAALFTTTLELIRVNTWSPSVILRTQELKCGTTNYKTIVSIAFDFDMTLLTDVYCNIYIPTLKTGVYNLLKSVKVTDQGVAFPAVTCRLFQIEVTFKPLAKVALRNYEIKIQYSDKRFGYGGLDVKQIVA